MALPNIAPGYMETIARGRIQAREAEKEREFAAAQNDTKFLQSLGSGVLDAAMRLGSDIASTAYADSLSRPLKEAAAGIYPEGTQMTRPAPTLTLPSMFTSAPAAASEAPAQPPAVTPAPAAKPPRTLPTDAQEFIALADPNRALPPRKAAPFIEDIAGAPRRPFEPAAPVAEVKARPVAPAPVAPAPAAKPQGMMGTVQGLGARVQAAAPKVEPVPFEPVGPQNDRGLAWLAAQTRKDAESQRALRDAQRANAQAEADARKAAAAAGPDPKKAAEAQKIMDENFIRRASAYRGKEDQLVKINAEGKIERDDRPLYEQAKLAYNQKIAEISKAYEKRQSGSGSLGTGISGSASTNYPGTKIGVVSDEHGWDFAVRPDPATGLYKGADLDGDERTFELVQMDKRGTIGWREVDAPKPAAKEEPAAPAAPVGGAPIIDSRKPAGPRKQGGGAAPPKVDVPTKAPAGAAPAKEPVVTPGDPKNPYGKSFQAPAGLSITDYDKMALDIQNMYENGITDSRGQVYTENEYQDNLAKIEAARKLAVSTQAEADRKAAAALAAGKPAAEAAKEQKGEAKNWRKTVADAEAAERKAVSELLTSPQYPKGWGKSFVQPMASEYTAAPLPAGAAVLPRSTAEAAFRGLDIPKGLTKPQEDYYKYIQSAAAGYRKAQKQILRDKKVSDLRAGYEKFNQDPNPNAEDFLDVLRKSGVTLDPGYKLPEGVPSSQAEPPPEINELALRIDQQDWPKSKKRRVFLAEAKKRGLA